MAEQQEIKTGVEMDAAVSQLLAALESHGLTQEREEVLLMARYIDTVENKLTQMVDTLQEMREQVQKMQDKSLAGRCGKLVPAAEDKVQESRNGLAQMKDKFLKAVRDTVQNLQTKSRETLLRAVRAMKIPAALDRVSTTFREAAQSMGNIARDLDTTREQLHTSGGYLKNAMRVLVGKSAQETSALEADKGALAKLRGMAEGLESSFTGLSEKARDLQRKLEPEQAPSQAEEETVAQGTLEEAPEELTAEPTAEPGREEMPEYLPEGAEGCVLQVGEAAEITREAMPELDLSEPELEM